MKAPSFQFYAGDFLVGTATMTAEEVGGYIRLLCYQWTNGRLVNDPVILSRITGCTSNALAVIMHKFCIDDAGMIYNERLEEVRKDKAEFAASRSENAKKRWEKQKNSTQSNASASPVHCINDALQSSVFSLQSLSPLPSPEVSQNVETPTEASNRRASERTLPESIDTEPFRKSWGDWLEYWADAFNRGKPMPSQTADRQLQTLASMGPILAVRAIENAMEKGGLRSPCLPNVSSKPTTPQPVRIQT